MLVLAIELFCSENAAAIMRGLSEFRNPHSAFERFLLAISVGVRTVGGHEACQAVCRPRIFVGLWRCDRR
jgi:hypothetical protein